MKRVSYPALMALVFATACREQAEHVSQPSPASAPPFEGNPVQQEMRLLTEALDEAVRGIGSGDVRALEHALHGVHAAKTATEAAIRDGSYRPPKNPDRLGRFHGLDEAFHGDLVRLADTSRRNDVAGTAEAVGTVLRHCHGCHAEFRP